MNNHLIDLEKQALAFKNAGDMAQASAVLERLLKIQPRWEHGYGFFSLAECYEELARFDDARNAYNEALKCGSDDPTILGGYASFLYLHGKASEALSAYLKLLQMEYSQGNQSASENTKIALGALAEKLGMPKSWD